MEIVESGYEWSVRDMVRIYDLSQWPTDWTFYEDSFFNEKIGYSEFHKRLSQCSYKVRSMPRKTANYLTYRMYGLVPYNLSPIQQGIQFGHAVVDFQWQNADVPHTGLAYTKWSKIDKTFIILNGGTTNNNPDRLGTLQQYRDLLKMNDVACAEFYEPDLNDTLTAVVFLVDERVFDREMYPDFQEDLMVSVNKSMIQYQKWVERIGGQQNEFLRNFLPKFKLA